MSPNNNNFSPEMYDRFDFKTAEVYSSKIRYRILLLLYIYRELSLTEIAEKMKKSKPAIHHHLKKMIEAEVVEESKEIAVRGSIKSKYYRVISHRPPVIKKRDIKTLDVEERPRALEYLSKVIREGIPEYVNALEMINNYADYLEKEATRGNINVDEILNFFDENDLQYRQVFYLSREEHKRYIKYLEEFESKVENMIKEGRKNKKDLETNPYYVFTAILPIKTLLELEKP